MMKFDHLNDLVSILEKHSLNSTKSDFEQYHKKNLEEEESTTVFEDEQDLVFSSDEEGGNGGEHDIVFVDYSTPKVKKSDNGEDEEEEDQKLVKQEKAGLLDDTIDLSDDEKNDETTNFATFDDDQHQVSPLNYNNNNNGSNDGFEIVFDDGLADSEGDVMLSFSSPIKEVINSTKRQRSESESDSSHDGDEEEEESWGFDPKENSGGEEVDIHDQSLSVNGCWPTSLDSPPFISSCGKPTIFDQSTASLLEEMDEDNREDEEEEDSVEDGVGVGRTSGFRYQMSKLLHKVTTNIGGINIHSSSTKTDQDEGGDVLQQTHTLGDMKLDYETELMRILGEEEEDSDDEMVFDGDFSNLDSIHVSRDYPTEFGEAYILLNKVF